MTGACHAPVDGRQDKALADTDPTASPVPIEKSADLEMDGREDFQNLLCQVGGGNEQNHVASEQPPTPIFEVWVPCANHKIGRGFRRSRIPPRRAQCSFDGSAVKSAFALLLAKVTKPAAAAAKRVLIQPQ